MTVEAAEEVTTESVTRTAITAEETPPPLSSLAYTALTGETKPVLPSLAGVLGPSLPLPGVTAATESEREIGDDITSLARALSEDVTRPAITDDDEEETKVEPAETAIARSRHPHRRGCRRRSPSRRASSARRRCASPDRRCSGRARPGATAASSSRIRTTRSGDQRADAISIDPVSADPEDDDDCDVVISADPPDDD